jgi:hypothetical protein
MNTQLSRAKESRAAIQRINTAMRHLFIRGHYKPLGASGDAMIQALLTLRPEIYGSIIDDERVELEGFLYIFQRLPIGIEECNNIKLISREGFEDSNFPAIVPDKRRRNCYRVDKDQMLIEMTRGRSDIYDVLTHLTFMYMEAEKIRKNSMNTKGVVKREWIRLEEIIDMEKKGQEFNKERAYSYLSTILGRTFEETLEASKKFDKAKHVNSLFHIVYWLGKKSFEEYNGKTPREISFSSSLRERVGFHTYGEQWAAKIKRHLIKAKLQDKPLHIVSSNPHSIMNMLFGQVALKKEFPNLSAIDIAMELSKSGNGKLREKVTNYARKHGMIEISDDSGSNIYAQLFDTAQIDNEVLNKALDLNLEGQQKPVIFNMDYAFGEQAFETMDELLKPIEHENGKSPMNVSSVSVMGKAGILMGGKGDIMIPNAHIFEGSADNYPFHNDFNLEDFKDQGSQVFEGSMVTVLGTSLSNKDILRYFLKSSWKAIGVEMEGAHYQKAIQAASMIRKNISEHVKVRYAYYASDNPLESGQTLASGSLGISGVRPTYLIAKNILRAILK